MKAMIEIVDRDQVTCWVNIDHIVNIDERDAITNIHLSDGSWMQTETSASVMLEKLARAGAQA